MEKVLEILMWMGLAAVKFLFVPSSMMAVGHGPIQAIIVSTAGAILGISIFYGFGGWFFNRAKSSSKKKKVFTKWRRFMVRIKVNFGLIGLICISGLISVPVTSLLASKYFGDSKLTPVYLALGFLAWAILLAGGTHVIANVF